MSDQPSNTERQANNPPEYYVAVGASAGGLEALQEFFQHMPNNSGLAFIVIQHLSPDFKSVMAELLSRTTPMKIFNATDGAVVQADTVYLIPPRKNMMIAEGKLLLVDQIPEQGVNFPIDIFFRSLAKDQHHRSISVVLSGTGSDGSRGIQAIKEVGGLVMVQEPTSAKFDGMPYNAVKTGLADVVTEAQEMANKLIQYVNHPLISGKGQSLIRHVEDSESAFKEIFNLLKQRSDIDFTQYKTTTVARRIERRIGINGLNNLQDYHALLFNKPQEIQILAKDMLIGVTRFFRDSEFFEQLEKNVIPNILAESRNEDPIRVWVAGCSTGEEAYSVAILFDEALGNLGEPRSVKIFATDVDPDAIAEASSGQFSVNVRDDLKPERVKKYFIQSEDHVTVIPSIRQMVVFANHNLIKDPPFSNIQLALCRNVLIYFQPEAQRRVLSMLHFSLQKHGYLFLGASESLNDFQSHFEVVYERGRIFRKIVNIRISNTPIPPARPHSGRNNSIPTVEQLLRSYQSGQKGIHNSQVVDSLIEDYVPPCIVLSEDLDVLHVYGDVTPYTRKLKSGRFSANIKDFISEELSVAVSTAVHRALSQEENVQYDNIRVHHSSSESPMFVNLRIRYLKPSRINSCAIVLLFESKEGGHTKLSEEAISYDANEQSQQRIFDLESQLQKNQEHLQVTVEELETTNEELQSSNEELLAANEELQSTNEELQSVNEELYTVNSEYQEKIAELTQVNTDLDNIMKSANIGIVFLDEAMLIRSFNPAVTQEINLLNTDIGRPFHHIAHNLIYESLLNDIAAVNDQATSIEREVKSKSSRFFVIKITPYYTEHRAPQGCVITLTDVTQSRELQNKLEETYQELRSTIDAAFLTPQSPIKVLIVDDDATDREQIRRAITPLNGTNVCYDIHDASSVASAVKQLGHQLYDVCLIDYNLKEKNAFDLIESLPHSSHRPAFIMLSGMLDRNLQEKAIHLGVYDAISKDVITHDLLERCIRYSMRQKQTETYLSRSYQVEEMA